MHGLQYRWASALEDRRGALTPISQDYPGEWQDERLYAQAASASATAALSAAQPPRRQQRRGTQRRTTQREGISKHNARKQRPLPSQSPQPPRPENTDGSLDTMAASRAGLAEEDARFRAELETWQKQVSDMRAVILYVNISRAWF